MRGTYITVASVVHPRSTSLVSTMFIYVFDAGAHSWRAVILTSKPKDSDHSLKKGDVWIERQLNYVVAA